MLQADKPDDYILATNKTTSIRDFAFTAFKKVGIDIKWIGEGIKEKGIDISNNETVVEISEDFYRPAEVELLIGDYSKAKKILNWSPKTELNELIEIMIKYCKKNKS
jgi:GDPmannose 4,6-dehydratase